MKGTNLSEEHKRLISKALTGIKRPKQTTEHRKKTGMIHKNKIVSNDTKFKMSISKIGVCHSELRKKTNSVSHSKINWNFISPDGSLVTFKNLTGFCKNNNLKQSAMWRVSKGILNHHKGWKRYV